MWQEVIGGIFFIGYVSFTGSQIIYATNPPVCDASTVHCALPLMNHGTPYVVHAWLTSRDVTSISKVQDADLGTIYKPTYDDSVYVGSISTIFGSEDACGSSKILKGEGTTDKAVKRWFRSARCENSLRASVPLSWHNNNTRVHLTVYPTATDDFTRFAFAPTTSSISLMYSPEKKDKSSLYYLLDPKKEPVKTGVDVKYMAYPPKVRIGPVDATDAYDRDKLLATGRSHWLQGASYRPECLVDTYVSPRDEYIPMVEEGSVLARGASKDVSLILSATSWRKNAVEKLMVNAVEKMETQFGTTQYEVDSLKLLLSGSSPILLLVTFVVSVLHMVFEFLAMASSWSFFRETCKSEDRAKVISSRSILMDTVFEIFILAWLWDEGEAYLMQFLILAKIVFNSWKYTKLSKLNSGSEGKRWYQMVSMNAFECLDKSKWREYRARLSSEDFELWGLLCLGTLTLPIWICWVIYQVFFVPQKGWWSMAVKVCAHLAYCGGFVSMTPQLFKNYYYRSVESLPWVALIYNALNTVIDDLFSFLIRMPREHRISVFRDDIIFVIYWIQKWHYKNGGKKNTASDHVDDGQVASGKKRAGLKRRASSKKQEATQCELSPKTTATAETRAVKTKPKK